MKKLILFLVCLFAIDAHGQSNDALCDRFLIKTDICPMLLDNAFTLEAEVRVSKSSTLTLGVFNGSDNYSQESSYFSSSGIEKGVINSQYYYLEYKKYAGKVWKAPVGSYFLLEAGYGHADIAGDCPADKLDPSFAAAISYNDPTGRPSIKYAFFDVPLAKFGFGFGTQRLMFWHIYYDFSFKFEYYTFMASDDTQSTMISDIARNYGPNLIHFTNGSDGSIGFSVNFKLGCLLY